MVLYRKKKRVKRRRRETNLMPPLLKSISSIAPGTSLKPLLPVYVPSYSIVRPYDTRDLGTGKI